ncbi:hypothetical protein MNB_SV-15-615 [hydrothermal vent metagenome]|uniref:L,D-TPase catalytic domain-containing protein n=1 Tax=hydrothermal vent metagenome TaxID=652676 RepID=A0A1W1EJV4_9ZZZZ
MRYFKVIIILLLTTTTFAFSNSDSFYVNVTNSITKTLQNKSNNNSIKQVYKNLYFVPIWINEDKLSYLALSLFRIIEKDYTISHNSNIYKRFKALELLSKNVYNSGDIENKIELELKITGLYLSYATHAIYGDINWSAFRRKMKIEWKTDKPLSSPIEALKKFVANGEINFSLFEPKTFGYSKLKKEIKRYREYQMSGKWKPLPDFGSLKVGTTSSALPMIRERLRFMGDYGDCKNFSSTKSDLCIKNALIRFQKRHGVAVTGYVNKRTKALLRESIEYKIQKMSLNLDRIKWLNKKVYSKQIVINIPAFELNFLSNSRSIQNMRVVIGKRNHRTPVFSNIVRTIILNPYWNVPASILEKEFLSKLKRNSNYLKRKNMKLYAGWNGKAIDASTVDWKSYKNGARVPYRVSQLPGSRNALGKIKFLFPNRYAVYMHDTPSKYLFKRRVRAFSHGCIRLQNPRGLLKTFASFNKSINYTTSVKILKGKTRKALSLNVKVPIDVIYLTTWIDDNGILQYRDDIYGYDRLQLATRRRY